MAFDTGGTMSDTFIIDEEGIFVVGKAQTTPENESEGILDSIRDALEQWKTSIEISGHSIGALVYSVVTTPSNIGLALLALASFLVVLKFFYTFRAKNQGELYKLGDSQKELESQLKAFKPKTSEPPKE